MKFTAYGTNYCGPGGSGPIKNEFDLACYMHDRGYKRPFGLDYFRSDYQDEMFLQRIQKEKGLSPAIARRFFENKIKFWRTVDSFFNMTNSRNTTRPLHWWEMPYYKFAGDGPNMSSNVPLAKKRYIPSARVQRSKRIRRAVNRKRVIGPNPLASESRAVAIRRPLRRQYAFNPTTRYRYFKPGFRNGYLNKSKARSRRSFRK